MVCLKLVVILTLLKSVLSLSNPCPSVFQYVRENGDIIGKVRVANIPSSTVNLLVKLSLPAQLSSNYVGEIKTSNTNLNAVTNDYQRSGYLLYNVYFPLPQPLPNVVLITVNGNPICSGPPASGSYVTTISLSHNLILSININPSVFPIFQQPKPSFQPVPPPSVPELDDYIDEPVPQRKKPSGHKRKKEKYCGISGPKRSQLIVNGVPTKRGKYPWHTALYRQLEQSHTFICGGNLISEKHVLTAAHCINNGRVREKDIEDHYVVLGKQKLRRNEKGSLPVNLIDILVHPEYVPDQPDADIALLVLEERVTYTAFNDTAMREVRFYGNTHAYIAKISPICLTVPKIQDNLLDNIGTIVGWGRDERGRKVTNELKGTTLKPVSNEECIESNPKFRVIVTDNTFCAGGELPNTGPCNGDSGGGLYIEAEGKWHLRGIVSTSLASNTSSCDPTNYSIFVDTTKYYSWIDNQMLDS